MVFRVGMTWMRLVFQRYFESEKIQVNGLIVNELSTVASHWDCELVLWINGYTMKRYLESAELTHVI